MRFRSYSTEGVVLARRNFREADRIINIFSKDFGKLTFLARGVRRTTSRKRGSLEVGTYLKLQGSIGNGSFDTLVEVQTIKNFENIKKDLGKTSVLFFILESVDKLTREDEPHPELFSLLINTLEKLNSKGNLKKLRDDFTTHSLEILGFWPQGKILEDPDFFLQATIEKRINTIRIGKKLLS